VNRRCGAGHVEDAVDLQQNRIDDIVADDFEPVIVEQMGHMLAPTCKEVIEADDLVTIVEEALAEMRADETSAACNQNSH
jgi:hypothetical protein